MLYDRFVGQVRMVISAPMQSERLGMGMISITRGVMFGVGAPIILYIINNTEQLRHFRLLKT